MRSPLIVVLAALAVVTADDCSTGSTEIDGNWYCQPVTAITYSNVGTPGSYNKIVDMAPNGVCSSILRTFAGPIAPLDEELSMHFRGPIQIKQFAAYSPIVSLSNKRDVSPAQIRRHSHQHEAFHKCANSGVTHGKGKRQEVTATIDGQVVSWENDWFGPPATSLTASSTSSTASVEWVTATIDGQVVSWINNYFGPPHDTVTSSAQMVTATIGGVVVSWVNDWFGEAETTPAPTTFVTSPVQMVTATVDGKVVFLQSNHGAAPTAVPASSATFKSVSAPTVETAANFDNAIEVPSDAPITSPTGTPLVIDNSTVYQRIGYYNSMTQELDNLVFLANYGGQGSGVFDFNYGASLSYVSSDGTSGASSPQILADITIPSDHEITIMTAQECNDSDCGYVRSGAVVYHGFGGADKVFMLEFAMPMDGEDGFEGNEPAWWALNANIPRTLQYGDPSCSCWESGCGELDIMEALDDGSARMKSTLHDNTSGGDSDYFNRPISATMKVAVVFSSSSAAIHIQVLPDSTDFSLTYTAGEIQGMCADSSGNLSSLFTIS